MEMKMGLKTGIHTVSQERKTGFNQILTTKNQILTEMKFSNREKVATSITKTSSTMIVKRITCKIAHPIIIR